MLVLLKAETQTHTLNFGFVLQNKILDTWKIKLHPLFVELRLIFLVCQTGATIFIITNSGV